MTIKGKASAMSEEHLVRFLKAAKKRSQRDYAAFLVGFHHGLRISEIASLTFADLDRKNDRLRVNRAKNSQNTIQSLQTVKGQPILDEKRALRDWLEQREDASPYLFPSQKGGKIDVSALFRAFQAAIKDAKLEGHHYSPHSLKHTRGRLLAEAGTNLSMIKEWLGHKSILSTAVYAVPSAQAVERAVMAANLETF